MAVDKHIKLSDEAAEIISNIQIEKGLASWNRALEFLVMDYANNCDVAEKVSKKVSEDLSKVLTRIRLGTTTADINSQVIIELLNAMIYQFNVEPMTTDYVQTTAVETSKKYVRNKIAKAKQNKDQKQHNREGLDE